MIPAKTSLISGSLKTIVSGLKKANASFAKNYPGDSAGRQAVHTVYGGAHLFKADAAAKLGNLALKSLETYAPNAQAFAVALGLRRGEFAETIYSRVIEKLKREAIEDYRIDFEDGYGNRPDAEEDLHAEQAASHLAEGMAQNSLPPFTGIRVKPLSNELYNRSIRTLDIFLTTLASKSRGRVPPNFVVTLPKVVTPGHVAALAKLLAALEAKCKFPSRSLKIEIMVETPQSIITKDGVCALMELITAGEGRCVSVHFGTYDYTALCNITAAHQSMTHQSCDFAKHVMQVALAQTGVNLADGATTTMPVPAHRASLQGPGLTPDQIRENQTAIHRAWKLHFNNIRHSLETGYYQGWDLHPAQLPIRYAAVYSFFLESHKAATHRLKTFVEKAALAPLIGDVFDDAATGQGLLNFFLRGLSCGAITLEEAHATGLTREDFESRSFLKILKNRQRH
ncbi:MAG: phosphoenolpyruvate kinase [Elusimicrobiota bacterium]